MGLVVGLDGSGPGPTIDAHIQVQPATATPQATASAAPPTVNTAAPSKPPPTSSTRAPQLHHVAIGHFLHARPVPDGNADAIATVQGGEPVEIVCQTYGTRVTDPSSSVSTPVWDKLDDGSYITDLWVDTNKSLNAQPGTVPDPRFDPGLPHC